MSMIHIEYGRVKVTIAEEEEADVFDEDYEIDDEEFDDPMIEADPEEAEIPEELEAD